MDQRQGKAPSAAPAITKIPVPVSPARPGRVREGRGVSERVSRVSYYSTKQNHLLSAVPGAFPARSRLPRHTIICGCSLPPVCGQQPKPEHEAACLGCPNEVHDSRAPGKSTSVNRQIRAIHFCPRQPEKPGPGREQLWLRGERPRTASACSSLSPGPRGVL